MRNMITTATGRTRNGDHPDPAQMSWQKARAAYWTALDAHNADPTDSTLNRLRITSAAVALANTGHGAAALLLLDGGPTGDPAAWTGTEWTAAFTLRNLEARPHNPALAARNGAAHHLMA